jgi:hypothetical protein
MTSDRVDLHRRLARAKWETYATGPEVGHISYGDEWIYAPGMVMMHPHFNNGEDSRMSEMLTDEMAPYLAKIDPEDRLTCEMRMYWKKMPDFRIVTPFNCRAEEWGFAMRDDYSGTTHDGRVVTVHEWDYIWTNDDGHITRWEWFQDSADWRPLLAEAGLELEGLTYQAYILNYLQKGIPDG